MKMFRWIGKIMIASVLISSLSTATTWFVVNLYIEEMFRQYQLPQLGKKMQFSDFTARLSEELNIVRPRDEGKAAEKTTSAPSLPAAPPNEKKADSGAAASATPAASPEGTSAPNAQSKEEKGADDDAVAVWNQSSQHKESAESTGQKRGVVLSTEEFAKKKELLSNEDKMKIFTLLISKLPQTQVQHLSTLIEEGITAEELQEVERILRTYLKDDEFRQLEAIIEKY